MTFHNRNNWQSIEYSEVEYVNLNVPVVVSFVWTKEKEIKKLFWDT